MTDTLFKISIFYYLLLNYDDMLYSCHGFTVFNSDNFFTSMKHVLYVFKLCFLFLPVLCKSFEQELLIILYWTLIKLMIKFNVCIIFIH